ncbi:caspase family protein [Limnohabitans sp. 2KL-51]|uniref:caspase family protein n=1 Tax=Limnohabitans sp. 2KL-51 TaxID=1977911 RepID=UPI0013049EA1|nr:caspase family protein [Limnohabitans sp. 2KL-51]
MLIWTQPVFAADLKAQGWGLPTTVDANGMVTTLKGTGDQAGLQLALNANDLVTPPADGTLIYKGSFGYYYTGFMVQHADGLISLLYSTFEWEGTANIEVGQPVKKGKLLSTMRAGGPAQFKRLLNWDVYQLQADEFLELQKKLSHAQLNNSQMAHISETIKWLQTRKQIDIKRALGVGSFELGKDFELKKDVNAFTVQRLQNSISVPISWEYAYLMPAGEYGFKITSGNFFKTERQIKTYVSAGDALTHYVKKLSNGDFAFGTYDVTIPAVTRLARAPVAAQAIQVPVTTNIAQGPITAPLKPSDVLAVDLKAQGWGLPTSFDVNGMVTTYKGSRDHTGLHLYLNESAPVLAPADGTLIYKGSFGYYYTGFMVQHSDGLISLIYNQFEWESTANIEVGQPVKSGQLLSTMHAGGPGWNKGVLSWNVNQLNAEDLLELQKKLSHAQLNNSQTEHISETIKWLQTRKQIAIKSALQLGSFELAKDFELNKDVNVNAFTVQRIQNSIASPISWEYAYLMPAGTYTFNITSGLFFKTAHQILTFMSAGDAITHYVKKLPNGDFVFGKHDVTTSAVNSLARAPVAAQPIEVSAATNSSQDPTPAPLKPSADVVTQAPPAQIAQPSAPPQAPQSSAPPQVAQLSAPPQVTLPSAPPQVALPSAPPQVALPTTPPQVAQPLAPPQIAQASTPPQVAQPLTPQPEDDRVQKAQAEAQALREEVARQRLMLEQLTQAQKPTPIVNPPLAPTVPTRRALVIGNDNYQSVPRLLNAREDAQAMARSLSDMGFQVQLELDLRERNMRAALRQFKSRVEGGDEVIIFFAGHGVQLAGTNYLLPVDITGENEEQIRDESIQLQRILDDMTEKRAKFTLAMLDACRDNPFKGSGRSLGSRGLAPTNAATGQMVIFSAGTGQQALDKLGPNDPEKNGLFTRVFLKEMQKPGISVDRILRNVRTEVVNLAKTVGHDQVPAIYDQVVGEYFLKR